MRLILKVIGYYGVVILIPFGCPCQSRQISISRYFIGIPQIHVMAGCIGLGAVYIYHHLKAVFLRKCQEIFKDLQAVHGVELGIVGIIVIGAGIRACSPFV